MRKFWIVEYVDVNVPKVERSEVCLRKADAVQRTTKRASVLHYETLETFAGRGLCDYLRNTRLFDNELSA
jgi:hypothetical protein